MSTIAYQGIVGSYNEAAAKKFVQERSLPDPTYLPAVTSQGVIDALHKSQAEFGVLAFKNSTAGEVAETRDALHGLAYEFLDETDLRIEHCLFSRGPLEPETITSVFPIRRPCVNARIISPGWLPGPSSKRNGIPRWLPTGWPTVTMTKRRRCCAAGRPAKAAACT